MLPVHIDFAFDVFLMQLRRKRRLARERRRRRYWVHPITSARMPRGSFSSLYRDLRGHPEMFRGHFRMSVSSFDELLQRVSQRIQRHDMSSQESVPPVERLMVTLQYLATGESFASLHYQFRLRKSTVALIVQDTCQALWELLHDEFIPHPSTQQWNIIAEKFFAVTKFPNCIGALGSKHIRIKKPHNAGSQYYNYRKYFSSILMAIADSQHRFVAVDIGAYGQANESRAFKNSCLGQRLYSGDFGIPEPRPFPGNNAPPMPLVLLASEAFQMCPNLLKPYASRGLNYKKRIFNYRLARARRMVDCAFGILTEKWRIFTTSVQLLPDALVDVIKACVVLHNFVLHKEPLSLNQQEMQCNPRSLTPSGPRSTTAVNQMRDKFAEYFLSHSGWLQGQESMIWNCIHLCVTLCPAEPGLSSCPSDHKACTLGKTEESGLRVAAP